MRILPSLTVALSAATIMFATAAQADLFITGNQWDVQAHCPGETVVWIDLRKDQFVYHMPGHYKPVMGWGWYVCLKEMPLVNRNQEWKHLRPFKRAPGE